MFWASLSEPHIYVCDIVICLSVSQEYLNCSLQLEDMFLYVYVAAVIHYQAKRKA